MSERDRVAVARGHSVGFWCCSGCGGDGGWFRGTVGRRWGRARAAGIVARGLGRLGCGRRLVGSAGGGWERFEFRERSDELGGPGPGVLEVQFRLAAVEREPAGDV
jgi:hypothetical protein